MSNPMVDFILIDMEHQPYDRFYLRNFMLVLNSTREIIRKGNLQSNIAFLVHLLTECAEPVHALIKQVLDVDVHGVVIPLVRTTAEAEKIVKVCRYVLHESSKIKVPIGMRGASPWLSSFFGGIMDEYFGRADVWPLNPDGDILAIIMIEEKEGIENIDEILKVGRIGAVLFGPYDFSFSIGYPGNVDHPKVLENWNFVKQACDKANVPLIGFTNPNDIQ